MLRTSAVPVYGRPHSARLRRLACYLRASADTSLAPQIESGKVQVRHVNPIVRASPENPEFDQVVDQIRRSVRGWTYDAVSVHRSPASVPVRAEESGDLGAGPRHQSIFLQSDADSLQPRPLTRSALSDMIVGHVVKRLAESRGVNQPGRTQRLVDHLFAGSLFKQPNQRTRTDLAVPISQMSKHPAAYKSLLPFGSHEFAGQPFEQGPCVTGFLDFRDQPQRGVLIEPKSSPLTICCEIIRRIGDTFCQHGQQCRVGPSELGTVGASLASDPRESRLPVGCSREGLATILVCGSHAGENPCRLKFRSERRKISWPSAYPSQRKRL